MTDTDARVERVKTELERFRTDAASMTVDRPCALCRHFKRNGYAYNGTHYVYGLCRNPVAQSVAPNFKDGGLKLGDEPHFEEMRAVDGLCGPEGLLFDPPDPPPPSFFERIFRGRA